MLTGFLNINTNGTITGDNANSISPVNGKPHSSSVVKGAASEDGLNLNSDNSPTKNLSDNFISILLAILSGLNNASKKTSHHDSNNKNSFQILTEKGQTGNALKFEGIVDVTSLANNNLAAPEGIAINALNQLLSGIQLSGVVQTINTAVKTDSMQKIKIHININNQANSNAIANANTNANAIANANTNANAIANAIANANVNANTTNKQSLQAKATNSAVQSEANGFVMTISNAALKPVPEILSRGNEPAGIMIKAMELKNSAGSGESLQRNGIEAIQPQMRGSESSDRNAGALNSNYQTAHMQDAPLKESLHVSKLHEIGNSFTKTLNSNSKHLIVEIQPPDLGSIQIKLKMTDGVLTANLKVDSVYVKELFSSALPQIRASLADSGIKLNDFFVDVKKEDGFYASNYNSMKQHRDGSHQDNQRQKKEQEFKFDYFA